MNWLADNALAIWMGGAVALTMALIVYLQTRTNKALLAIGAVIGLTAALLGVEWFIETPREAVERTLYELAATVEANDVPRALGFLAPSANSQIRKDIETLMPQVTLERARIINTPEIELDTTGNSATVRCRGIILGKTKKDGMKIGGGGDETITTEWIHQGNRWLVEGYTSERNWNRALGR